MVSVVLLLMSGLAIFNAHPRLYWGTYGANPDPAWLEIGAVGDKGLVIFAGHPFETTGVLGLRHDEEGRAHPGAFPNWATLPAGYDLAGARRWHLTIAWLYTVIGAWYVVAGMLNGHFRRDLAPFRSSNPVEHPPGAHYCPYKLPQRLAYVAVLLLLLPVMVLSGLTMSPSATATAPWLLDIFGGRQSGRSIHFISAVLIVIFSIGHVGLVIWGRPIRKLRSMLTGRYPRAAGGAK